MFSLFCALFAALFALFAVFINAYLAYAFLLDFVITKKLNKNKENLNQLLSWVDRLLSVEYRDLTFGQRDDLVQVLVLLGLEAGRLEAQQRRYQRVIGMPGRCGRGVGVGIGTVFDPLVLGAVGGFLACRRAAVPRRSCVLQQSAFILPLLINSPSLLQQIHAAAVSLFQGIFYVWGIVLGSVTAVYGFIIKGLTYIFGVPFGNQPVYAPFNEEGDPRNWVWPVWHIVEGHIGWGFWLVRIVLPLVLYLAAIFFWVRVLADVRPSYVVYGPVKWTLILASWGWIMQPVFSLFTNGRVSYPATMAMLVVWFFGTIQLAWGGFIRPNSRGAQIQQRVAWLRSNRDFEKSRRRRPRKK